MGKKRYIAADVLPNGRPSISFDETNLEYTDRMPVGYAEIRTIQAGACSSDVMYYLPPPDGGPSRFVKDLSDKEKRTYYFDRNLEAGILREPANEKALQEMLLHTMFHEAFGRVSKVRPDFKRPKVPIQIYAPKRRGDGFVKNIVETNFQEGVQPDSLVVRNPQVICNKHSRADTINPETGWPYQCHRSYEEGHIPKGTIGHTEFIGAAVDGCLRIPVEALTPVPEILQKFVEEDVRGRGYLLTAIEPLSCIFDAFGILLQTGEVPDSVVIIGDGPNALNTVAFLLVLAPDAQVVVVGKHEEKLGSFRKINPHVIPVTTDGEDVSGVASVLEDAGRGGKADVVMPTVLLPEDKVAPFVKEGGLVVWWAAAVSSKHAKQANSLPKRYRERFPYGGAPRAEFSAMALMEYFVERRPEVIDALLTYPGLYYTTIGESAAADIQEWLEQRGRLVRTVLTPSGPKELSVKPVITMTLI